ncbi:UNVERIFIED_ORG: DNA-binding SARP family transcriptional activator [Rhizobium esperanzae]
MPTNRLCLLGRPRLLAAGRELSLPEKSYFLLAMLAAEADLELDRETVRRQLWQSELPEKRAGSLRQLLARIEQSIPADLPPLLAATRTHIGLADGWACRRLGSRRSFAEAEGAARSRGHRHLEWRTA